MSLDADSIAYLEDVKKGKPRRFVMICKGVRIMSMVVYKKGTVERYKKQAKEEGKGQFYHGVIDGKGLSITFKLCRADGYDEPPGKALILKDFLSTETGIRFKPEYEIVDVLPDVAEHDEVEGFETEGDELGTPPAAPPIPVSEEKEGQEEESESAPNPAVVFNERLKALLPDIKAAAGKLAGDEAKRLVTEAGDYARKKDFAEANSLLEEAAAILEMHGGDADEEKEDPAELFNERLKALLSDVKAAVGTPAGDEAKQIIQEAGTFARKKDFDQGNELLEKAHEILNDWAAQLGNLDRDPAIVFNERLKALLPDVKAAAGTMAGDEAKRLVTEAGDYARKKEFPEAISLLDEAEDILEMHGGEDAKTDVDPAIAFNGRLKALLPDVKAAAGTPAGDGAKLKVSEAGVFAKKKDFVQAGALLDQAEATLRRGGASSGPSDLSDINPGIVKKRKFLIERWKQIQVEINTNLMELQKALERDVPDEDADLLVELSADYLNDFCDDMKESIDEDINAGDAKYKNAISTIKAFRTQITSDPLIQHLKSNPLRANVGVDSVLLNALTEVEQTLAS